MKYRIYHNSRCRKSREGLQFLQEKSSDFEVIEYLKQEFTEESLREVLDSLGMEADELTRKQEADYKEGVKGRSLSNSELIRYMVAHPKLIERPIVMNMETKKAVIARPVEKILEII